MGLCRVITSIPDGRGDINGSSKNSVTICEDCCYKTDGIGGLSAPAELTNDLNGKRHR
jgi:hypothetical protein